MWVGGYNALRDFGGEGIYAYGAMIGFAFDSEVKRRIKKHKNYTIVIKYIFVYFPPS